MNVSEYVNSKPSGFDKAIADLQKALGCISWFDKVYGRATEHKVPERSMVQRTTGDLYSSETRSRLVRQPRAYAGDGEYIILLPNDELKCYGFFVATGPEEFEEKQRKFAPLKATRNVALIVWADLKALGHDFPNTEPMKADVVKVLQKEKCVQSINSYIDEHSEQIFEGFDLDEIKGEKLAYPYGGFRLNITVEYSYSC
jgi:hypothetical protein